MEQSLKDDLAKLRRKLFIQTCNEVCKQSGSEKDETQELTTVINLFMKLVFFLAIRFKHKNTIEFVISVLYNLWVWHLEHKADLEKSYQEVKEDLENNID